MTAFSAMDPHTNMRALWQSVFFVLSLSVLIFIELKLRVFRELLKKGTTRRKYKEREKWNFLHIFFNFVSSCPCCRSKICEMHMRIEFMSIQDFVKPTIRPYYRYVSNWRYSLRSKHIEQVEVLSTLCVTHSAPASDFQCTIIIFF